MIKKILNFFKFLLLVLGLVLCIYVLWMSLNKKEISVFGYKMYVIKSDSMVPFIKVDDVILVYEDEVFNLNKNTVITFDFNDNINIPNTHRIVGYYYKYLVDDNYFYDSSFDYDSISELEENNPSWEVIGYRTKGDNLKSSLDPIPVLFDSVRGVYVKKLEVMTLFYSVLSNKLGFLFIVIIPLVILLLGQIVSLFKLIKNKECY